MTHPNPKGEAVIPVNAEGIACAAGTVAGKVARVVHDQALNALLVDELLGTRVHGNQLADALEQFGNAIAHHAPDSTIGDVGELFRAAQYLRDPEGWAKIEAEADQRRRAESDAMGPDDDDDDQADSWKAGAA